MTLSIFVPGYALSMAIFPKKDSISIIERLGLSLILGFTPPFILYFFAKNLFIPMNTQTSAMALLGTTIFSLVIWALRSGRISLDDAISDENKKDYTSSKA